MIAIGVTTAPRPRPTLCASLESFRSAGFTQRVMVFSDLAEVVGANLDVRINTPPLGGLRNWCHALETLYRETTAGWLMVLEDDITWAPGSWRALEGDLQALDPAGVGYLSLYLPRQVSRRMERKRGRLAPGWYPSPMGWSTWGSQAFVLPRAAAGALLADPVFERYRRTYEKNRNRDNIVASCLKGLGLRRMYRVPCLVNHDLGSANSSLGPKPVQRSLMTDYWAGAPC